MHELDIGDLGNSLFKIPKLIKDNCTEKDEKYMAEAIGDDVTIFDIMSLQ